MGNPVGRLRKSFTDEQFDLIIGTLLGDGRLEQRSKGIRAYTARLRIHHGDAQRAYVFWKHKILQTLVATPPRRIQCGYDVVRKKRHYSWYFHTKSTQAFRILCDEFYAGGRKRIPDGIAELLTPRALAIWAMDDEGHAGPYFNFNSHCFTVTEQERLCAVLRERFSIDTSLHRDRSCWKIAVRSQSVPRLTKLIAPYVISSMSYKIAIPVSTFPPQAGGVTESSVANTSKSPIKQVARYSQYR